MNNKIQKGFVKYFDVQFVQGNWYAWYFVTEKLENMQNILTGGDDAS